MATYFVDATDGSDAADGLSEINAWQTVAKVNALTPAAGDIIQFKRGSVWNEGIDLATQADGTSGSVITYQDYDTGDLPIISSAKAFSGQSWKWTSSPAEANTYYIELTAGGNPSISNPQRLFYETRVSLTKGTLGSLADQEWAYGDQDTLGFNTVYLRNDAGVPAAVFVPQGLNTFRLDHEWITINNLIFEMSAGEFQACIHSFSKTGRTIDNITVRHAYGSGMQFDGVDIADWDANTSITNCTAHDHGREGIACTGFSKTPPPDVSTRNVGYLIDSCECFDCGVTGVQTGDGDGIQWFYIDDSIISNNICRDNTGNGINCDGDGFGGEGSGCSDDKVFNNECFNNGLSGILFEYYCKGNDIHHNKIYDNGSVAFAGGITVNHEGSEGNTIRYNLVKGQKSSGYQIGAIFDVASSPNRNHTIVHNTCDDDGLTTAAGISVERGEGHIIKNNLIIDSNRPIQVTGNVTGTLDIDYNIWSGNNQIQYDGNFWTLAQFVANTDHGDNSSFIAEGDLGLIDRDGSPAPGNYDLNGDSPAIDDGLTLSAGIYQEGDFLGRPVPSGSAPDVGAYEFAVTIMPWLRRRRKQSWQRQ